MTKVALITGASSGIGRATARLLAQAGYDIAVHYRAHRQSAEHVAEELRALGRRALIVQADTAQSEQVEQLYRTVERELGAPCAVVNSAGIGLPASKVGELDVSAVQQLFAVNVLGVISSCREAVKRMSRLRGGHGGVIVNISSMAATIGGRPGSAAYAASKAAVDAFSIGLAKEVAREGIRVISVRPGMVDTEMTHSRLQDPKFVETIRASIPVGRAAEPDEVAKPIRWLLSDEASFITGCCIDVSGGGFHIAR